MLLSVPWPNSRPSDLRFGSLLAPFDLLPYFGEYSFFDSEEIEDDEKVMNIVIGDGTTNMVGSYLHPSTYALIGEKILWTLK